MSSSVDLPSNESMRLRPGARVSLYQLDVNPIMPSGSAPVGIVYWVSAVDRTRGPVKFRGMTYQPMPVGTSDFKKVGEGKLPRPKLQVSNIQGTVTALMDQYYNLTGAWLTRMRTYEKYLDDGPAADPLKVLDVERWVLGQPTEIGRTICEFELYLPIDLENVFIPKNRILERCRWRYRGVECGWDGYNMDINNVKQGEVGYTGRDECNKLVKACRARFQAYRGGHADGNPNKDRRRPLPFGGFPGTGRPVR